MIPDEAQVAPPVTYTRGEWESLWHHLCARLAELRTTASRLDKRTPGWGDERLSQPISELERLVEVAYTNAKGDASA